MQANTDPPALQPRIHPNENAFSKLKSPLFKATARTAEALWSTTGRIVDAFTPDECANYVDAAGYNPA